MMRKKTKLADMYEMMIDSQVKISNYLKEPYKIVYRYNFGDNWEREIRINRILYGFRSMFPFDTIIILIINGYLRISKKTFDMDI